MARFTSVLIAAVAIALLLPTAVRAQITRFDLNVVESPALDGQHFGDIGQYEHLRGIVEGTVDPSDPRHADIVNLARAPRNLVGRVASRATVEVGQ